MEAGFSVECNSMTGEKLRIPRMPASFLMLTTKPAKTILALGWIREIGPEALKLLANARRVASKNTRCKATQRSILGCSQRRQPSLAFC